MGSRVSILVAAVLLNLPLLAVQTKVDVSGSWTGKSMMAGEPPKEEGIYAVLKQNGTEVTGTIGPRENHQFPITAGKIDTTQKDPVVTLETGRGDQTVTLVATFKDDTLTGTGTDAAYKTTFKIELKQVK